jgi:hypothetical protein
VFLSLLPIADLKTGNLNVTRSIPAHWRIFYTYMTSQLMRIYKYVRSHIILYKHVSVTPVTFTREPYNNRTITTGRFTMFSVITDIYNKKTKWTTLMELFTATGKIKKFLLTARYRIDVCTAGDTAHIDTIFKFLPHTCQHGCIDILHCCNDPCL